MTSNYFFLSKQDGFSLNGDGKTASSEEDFR